MAEVFSKGINHIWYRAANFNANVNVTVKFRKPDSALVGPISIPETDDGGIYCLDYDFDSLGQWVGIFFEDNIKTSSKIFHIVPKTSPAVPYDSGTMKCQTCSHFKMVHGKEYGICELIVGSNPYRWPDDTCPSYQDEST